MAALTASSSTASAQPRRKKPAPAASKEASPTANPNKTKAAELFKKSADAYLQGDFATAIKLLEEAYALDPQPVLVYNEARAHEGLGHLDEAISLYERYLTEEPTTSDRGAIEQRLATLRKQQEEKKRLEKEKADVEEKRLQQQERQEQLDKHAQEVRDAPPSEASRKRSVLPYVVVGVGGAGLATGAVFGILALNRQDAGRKATSLKDATEARDSGKRFATVSNVSFVVGGALVAGGAIWWVLDSSAVKRRQGMTDGAPKVSLGLGFGHVSLQGGF
jgi:tetratricopeptide (TPR) repeat protein